MMQNNLNTDQPYPFRQLAIAFGKSYFFAVLPISLCAFIYFLKQQGPYIDDLNSFYDNLKTIFGLILFIVVPIVQACIASLHIRHCKELPGKTYSATIINVLFIMNMVITVSLLKEGAACLVMAFPLLYAQLGVGIFFAKLLTPDNRKILRATFIPLIVILTLYQSQNSPVALADTVSSSIIIQAAPEKIWPYVISQPADKTVPSYWVWQLGVPAPTQSVVEAPQIGALRYCKFGSDNSAAYTSRITNLIPNQLLSFTVLEQVRNPEIYGHLSFEKGELRLINNGDGTSTLTTQGWYQLYIRPTTYFNWWARDGVKHTQMRILNHIKMLAENHVETGL